MVGVASNLKSKSTFVPDSETPLNSSQPPNLKVDSIKNRPEEAARYFNRVGDFFHFSELLRPSSPFGKVTLLTQNSQYAMEVSTENPEIVFLTRSGSTDTIPLVSEKLMNRAAIVGQGFNFSEVLANDCGWQATTSSAVQVISVSLRNDGLPNSAEPLPGFANEVQADTSLIWLAPGVGIDPFRVLNQNPNVTVEKSPRIFAETESGVIYRIRLGEDGNMRLASSEGSFVQRKSFFRELISSIFGQKKAQDDSGDELTIVTDTENPLVLRKGRPIQAIVTDGTTLSQFQTGKIRGLQVEGRAGSYTIGATVLAGESYVEAFEHLRGNKGEMAIAA